MMPRILAFASSTRRESFNKKLVAIAAQGAREAGAEVTLIDLKDFPLPLFDQDLEAEEGMPENGKKLKKLFIDHDGLLIASPEYNSSLPAVLKNAIDWVSRPAPGEPSLLAFRGKVAILMSASPGALAGLRGLLQVISGDSTPEDDDPSVDGDPDGAQYPVAGRTQGAFDSFGQAVVFQTLRKERGALLKSVLFLVGVLARGKAEGAFIS